MCSTASMKNPSTTAFNVPEEESSVVESMAPWNQAGANMTMLPITPPSPVVVVGQSFSWQDFPAVGGPTLVRDDHHAHVVVAQEAISNGYCEDETDRVMVAEKRLRIAPSPVISFESFSWGDFPIVSKPPPSMTESGDEDDTLPTTVSANSSLADDDIPSSWEVDSFVEEREAIRDDDFSEMEPIVVFQVESLHNPASR